MNVPGYETMSPPVSGKSELLPPRRLLWNGEKDYREEGKRYLGFFIDLAQLSPDEKVLDVGCGAGRMAVALTGYLSSQGSYEGFDIREDAIRWCRDEISSRFPNFRFLSADLHSRHYNPAGSGDASRYRFPYPDNSFDFVFLTSVFTHMTGQAMEHYLAETARVLRPEGRSFVTYFLLNQDSLRGIEANQSSFHFGFRSGPCRSISESDPESAIAYDETYIRTVYRETGLMIKEPVYCGCWCRKDKTWGQQDIIIAVKPSL